MWRSCRLKKEEKNLNADAAKYAKIQGHAAVALTSIVTRHYSATGQQEERGAGNGHCQAEGKGRGA